MREIHARPSSVSMRTKSWDGARLLNWGVLVFVLWNLGVLLRVIEALNLVSPHLGWLAQPFVLFVCLLFLFVLRVSIFDFWVSIFVLSGIVMGNS